MFTCVNCPASAYFGSNLSEPGCVETRQPRLWGASKRQRQALETNPGARPRAGVLEGNAQSNSRLSVILSARGVETPAGVGKRSPLRGVRQDTPGYADGACTNLASSRCSRR